MTNILFDISHYPWLGVTKEVFLCKVRLEEVVSVFLMDCAAIKITQEKDSN